jgi:hypothetical protein
MPRPGPRRDVGAAPPPVVADEYRATRSFERMGACPRTPGKAIQRTNLGPSVSFSRTVHLAASPTVEIMASKASPGLPGPWPFSAGPSRDAVLGRLGTWVTAFSTARAVEPLYRALNPSPACIWREHPYWSGQTRLGPSYRRVCEGGAASASTARRRSPAPIPPTSRIPGQPLARAPFPCTPSAGAGALQKASEPRMNRRGTSD